MEVGSCHWSMVDTEFCGMSESLVLRPGSVSWSVAESVRTPLKEMSVQWTSEVDRSPGESALV